MNQVTTDLAAVLAAATQLNLGGVAVAGATSDWMIFTELMPDSPARCILLRSVPPPPPQTFLGGETPMGEEPLQLSVRGITPEETFAKANVIRAYLYQLGGFVQGSTVYLRVLHGGGIFPLGWDDRRRFTHAVNMTAYRMLTT